MGETSQRTPPANATRDAQALSAPVESFLESRKCLFPFPFSPSVAVSRRLCPGEESSRFFVFIGLVIWLFELETVYVVILTIIYFVLTLALGVALAVFLSRA